MVKIQFILSKFDKHNKAQRLAKIFLKKYVGGVRATLSFRKMPRLNFRSIKLQLRGQKFTFKSVAKEISKPPFMAACG